MLKRSIKTVFNNVAARFGPHMKPGNSSKLWILMYHRILPESLAKQYNEEAGMYVTPETFEQHITWLNEIMTPVRLKDWVSEDNLAKKKPGNYFAITFDDGWRDNYQYAFPVLKEKEIPATIFLVSNMMDTKNIFWPNRLARVAKYLLDPNKQSFNMEKFRAKLGVDINNSSLDISDIIYHAKNFSDVELIKWLDDLEQELDIKNDNRQLLSWQEIKEMESSDLIDMGAHTKHHTRLLDSVENSTIDDEVIGCKDVLQQNIQSPIDLFCYPNGDFSDYSAELVTKNYLAAVTTQKGINSLNENLHKLKRVGVHQDISNSKRDFLACLACWR